MRKIFEARGCGSFRVSAGISGGISALVLGLLAQTGLASENKWTLGTGIVFPSLNGAMEDNAATYSRMAATAFELGYGKGETTRAGQSDRTVKVSLAKGGGSLGGGLGVASTGVGGSQGVSSLFGGLGVQLGGVGLGAMLEMPLSPSTGDVDASFGLSFPSAGDGVSFAIVVPESLDTVKAGVGMMRANEYGLEADLTVPVDSGDLAVGIGTRVQAGIFGVGFTSSTPINISTSSNGSRVGDTTFGGSVSMELISNATLIAEMPGSGLYLVSFNLAL